MLHDLAHCALDKLALPESTLRFARDIGLDRDFLNAARQAQRELDEVEKIKSIMGLDALEQARRSIGFDLVRETQRQARVLGLDYEYHLRLQRELLGQPPWLDAVAHLRSEIERFARGNLPWYIRDNVDLQWLVETKNITSIGDEHRRLVESMVAAALLERREPHRPWRPLDKERTFLTAAALLRTAARQLRAIRAYVQSLQAHLVRHFLFATRFTASIDPALG